MSNLAPLISRNTARPFYIDEWQPTDKYFTFLFNSEELTSFIHNMSLQVPTNEIRNRIAFLFNLSENHNITIEALVQEILLLRSEDELEEIYEASWDSLLEGAIAYLINFHSENPNELYEMVQDLFIQ